MMDPKVKRLTPTKETLIRLFAKTGNQCAFPDCTHEIFEENTLVAQVCHIEAAQESGERFNSDMNNEDRRGYSNLIILCHKHHKITNNIELFPVPVLQNMKKKHEDIQNKTLKLNTIQLKTVRSEIEAELSFKLDSVLKGVDEIKDRIDFYGRNKLSKGNHPEEDDFNLYFGKFLDDHVDIGALLLKAQPTLNDCKTIFTEEYYYDVFLYYAQFYRSRLLEANNDDTSLARLNEAHSFEYKKVSKNDLIGNRKNPHLMFRDNATLFTIRFLGINKEPGISFHFWCFINGRWVLFAKPAWAYREILSLRENREIKYISRIISRSIKFRMLPKGFLDLSEDQMAMGMRQVMREVKKK